MFDGNMFFEEQGIPILKIALNTMLFAEALPVPFSVAMEMLRSLISGVSIIEPVGYLPLPNFINLPGIDAKNKKRWRITPV